MEPNTKLVVITLVLALTLTAARGQPGICGISLNGLNACKRYVETTNPSLIATDLKGPCCAALSKANLQCLCEQKTNTFLGGIYLDLATKLPEKCGLFKETC